jgi:hypothetical protein
MITNLTSVFEYSFSQTTPSEMKRHGWTEAAINSILGTPDRLAINPHYSSGPPMRLYRVERVLAAETTPEFEILLRSKEERKLSAAKAQEKRFDGFRRRYGTWAAALSDACAYLFDLNRYAKKHGSCSEKNRDDIYDLKSAVVELLYRRGYCTDCYEHTIQLPERECFGCNGTGTWASYSSDDEESCRRCNGTGIYKKATERVFVCFKFGVDGTDYCWHQPEDFVNFDYDATSDAREWSPGDEEKPVSLNRRRFATAKDLLRWIVAQENISKDLPKAA